MGYLLTSRILDIFSPVSATIPEPKREERIERLMKLMAAIVFVALIAGCRGPDPATIVAVKPPAPKTAPSFVQALSSSCNAGAPGPTCTGTLTIAISPQAKNTILVPVWFTGPTRISVSVLDSKNDSFQPWATISQNTLSDEPGFLYAATNIAGGSTTITVSFNCLGSQCTANDAIPTVALAGAVEYQGLGFNGTDASVTNDGSLTTQTQGQVIDSGSFVTTVKNELAFGIAVGQFGVQPGSGWTARVGCTPSSGNPATGYFCFEEAPATQPGTFDATFLTDFAASGGLGNAPTLSAPNAFGVAAVTSY